MKAIQLLCSLFGLILAAAPFAAARKLPNDEQGSKSPSEGLILTQIVHRHGSRTPGGSFPTDPNGDHDYGVKGDEQLTMRGKKHGLALGRFLRDRYDGFLSREYSFDQVYVRASDLDRTIMTAQTVLSGLFPPSDPRQEGVNWQPGIPIHSLTPACDHFINSRASCPRLKKWKEEIWKDPASSALREDSLQFFPFLSAKSGNEIKSFHHVAELFDTLRVEQENGLRLPTWATENNVFPDRMFPYVRMHFQSYSYKPEQLRLHTGALLNELIQNMNAKTNRHQKDRGAVAREDKAGKDSQKAKMQLFSGHESTITPLMDTLGIYDPDNPPSYTAALMFELYNGTAPDDYIVKVLYRRKDNGGLDVRPVETITTELEIPNCRHPCTLSRFETAFSEFLIDTVEREVECKR